jgi:hypothetical protein
MLDGLVSTLPKCSSLVGPFVSYGENKRCLNLASFDCSRESMGSVQKLVREIENLSKLERLLLYLELPSSLSGIPDPLRQ